MIMELNLYFQMLRRGWWLIVLTALIAFAASMGTSYLVTPQYEAVARFIITPSSLSGTGPDTVLQSLNTLNDVTVMTTYAEVMKSNRIYAEAAAFLQLQTEELEDYTYEAVVLPSSSVLELKVTGPDPQVAAKLANSIGYQTINFTRGLNQVFNLDFLDTALPPVIPVSPQPLRDGFIAIVFGLIGGVVIALLNEQIRFSLESVRKYIHLDSVTGVYNSKHFLDLVKETLARNPEEMHTVGIVELNGIRDLFDTLPSALLQRVLQRVTETLRKELRGNDVIGRWSDISFIVLLPNTTGVAATRIFERILESLSEPVELDQFGAIATMDSRVGGAVYDNHINTQELLEKANSSLEQARTNSDAPIFVWELKNPFWTQNKMAAKKMETK
jgi:diguanylate cyclase (GGDEF)-like protein